MPTLFQINSGVNIGSTGRIVEQIGQYAKSNGWVSYVAYGRKNNNSKSNTIKIGNFIDFLIHILYSRIFDRHGLGSVKATKKLIKKILIINPDIIHLHNIHGYYINYQVLFEFLSGSDIPVVWTLHDCWSMTGHCSHFSNINCVKWKTSCHHCPKMKNYPTSLFIDRSFKNFKFKKELFNSVFRITIVTVSNWLDSLVKESYLSKIPLRVINNGIDLDVFYPLSDCADIKNKYGINQKFILLGVATAWSVGKGLNDYYKLREVLSNDYALVLVGLSKKQIKALHLNILGIERTENLTELSALYSASDIVLNLSYQETFGLTTVEGFACGTPGIVFNCTASPELITPETGKIVEPGNIGQLKQAIEEIRLNGKDFYSINCRKRAEDFYNKDNRYEEYIQLYDELIKN
ncbi:MAG: glycosyltransferase [Paludibacter sp.]|nr:glycosyltransferase [Paludibacter sp.]